MFADMTNNETIPYNIQTINSKLAPVNNAFDNRLTPNTKAMPSINVVKFFNIGSPFKPLRQRPFFIRKAHATQKEIGAP